MAKKRSISGFVFFIISNQLDMASWWTLTCFVWSTCATDNKQKEGRDLPADMWWEIARWLDAKSLVALLQCSRKLLRICNDDRLWEWQCAPMLYKPDACSWKQYYAAFLHFRRPDSLQFVSSDDSPACVITDSTVFVRDTNGALYSMGENWHGKCGTANPNKRQSHFHQITFPKRVVDFATGREHCLALTEDGQCWGWGSNRHGQLGAGFPEKEDVDAPKPLREIDGLCPVQVCCGDRYSCVLISSGTVMEFGILCWNGPCVSGERISMRGKNIVFACCCQSYVLVLNSIGTVFGWGNYQHGQLGKGD